MASARAQWGSRFGFILAAAGSAVGLGNIWKFPYITGENGGGLFVLIYLVCIGLVGIPIMMAEIMIGRAAQRQPVAAFHVLQGKRTGWAGVGWLGVLAGFIILSYYAVVAGWSMDYTLKSVVNFTQPIHDTAEREATSYRANGDLDEMRLAITRRRAAHESRTPLRLIRGEVRPSSRRAYDDYAAALEAAGVVNVAEAEAARRVWADQPAEAVARLEAGDEAGASIPGAMRDRCETIRERLFQKPGFEEKIREAEARLDDLAAERIGRLVATDAITSGLSEAAIRSEAEDLKRRQIIFERVSRTFMDLARDGWTCTLWSAIFLLLTIVIVSGGVAGGIERTCRILMPTLFVLILVMVVYGAFRPGFMEALGFVFKPDVHKLKASGVLEALGHAFFTLSLGMGAMITYGSYQRSKEALMGQSVTIAVLDTGLALLACLMIFPIIFTYDQEPAAGPGLVFMSMPLAFAEIGKGGMLLAILFFGLLVFAALTSAISLLEVVVSYFIDGQGWPRARAAWVLGGVIFLFSIPSAFSLDPNFAMAGWEPSFGKNFFDTLDYLATNWMLPMGGLLIAVYTGWVMPRRLRDAEVEGLARGLLLGWVVLIRIVAPALVIAVLLQKVGVLDADELFHGLLN